MAAQAPATAHTVRTEYPASTAVPVAKATTARISIDMAYSDEKTRPRNLSSVMRCSNVVDDDHPDEPPAWASITQAAAT